MWCHNQSVWNPIFSPRNSSPAARKPASHFKIESRLVTGMQRCTKKLSSSSIKTEQSSDCRLGFEYCLRGKQLESADCIWMKNALCSVCYYPITNSSSAKVYTLAGKVYKDIQPSHETSMSDLYSSFAGRCAPRCAAIKQAVWWW